MTTPVDPTGYQPAVGTLEDARAMVGHTAAPMVAVVGASAAMARHFCAMVEDSNRTYWDQEFAIDAWDCRPTPPAMLLTWCMPLEWTPDAVVPVPPLALRVPLPGETVINSSQEAEFRAPIEVGDVLTMTETVTAVSDAKTTFLGVGHFVTTEMVFTRGDNEVVAIMRNVLFRFTPHAPDASE